MWPKSRFESINSMLPVCSAEKKSVDSNAIRPIQTTAGHQTRRRLGREAGNAVRLSLLSRVVRSFARDHDVVHMAFAQAGSADAHESRLLLQLGDRLAAAVTHAGLQSAHHLVDD